MITEYNVKLNKEQEKQFNQHVRSACRATYTCPEVNWTPADSRERKLMRLEKLLDKYSGHSRLVKFINEADKPNSIVKLNEELLKTMAEDQAEYNRLLKEVWES